MEAPKKSIRITADNEPEAYTHIRAVYEQFRPIFAAKNIPMPPLVDVYIDGEISNTRSAIARSSGIYIQPRIVDALKKSTDGFTAEMFRGLIAHELWHMYEDHFVFVSPIAIFSLGGGLKRECSAYHAMGYLGYGPAEMARPSLLPGPRPQSNYHPNIQQRKELFENQALMKIPPGDVTFVAPIALFSNPPTHCEIEWVSPQYKALEKAARSAPTR